MSLSLPQLLAKHFREVHLGGNWTDVNLKSSLDGVTWQQATTKIESFNTIAALVYHINYYVSAMLKVLHQQPLDAHDKYSFNLPPIQSTDDWEKLLEKTWKDAEEFANLAEQFPESRLGDTFVNEKYGNYLRNFMGVVEHTHYHLGQIVIIKKLIQKEI